MAKIRSNKKFINLTVQEFREVLREEITPLLQEFKAGLTGSDKEAKPKAAKRRKKKVETPVEEPNAI